eukprot:UN27116
MLHCPERDLLKNKFKKKKDKPIVSGHTYYEGYFHCLPEFKNDSILSVDPRTNRLVEKPPAPLELIAFIQAFRNVNKDVIDNLKKKLHPKLQYIFDQNHHFADLSVQYHFGNEVDQEHKSWHLMDQVRCCNWLYLSLENVYSI